VDTIVEEERAHFCIRASHEDGRTELIPLLFSTREAAEKIVRHLRDNDAARYDIELYFETPSDRA
jgi:hypothetical protein